MTLDIEILKIQFKNRFKSINSSSSSLALVREASLEFFQQEEAYNKEFDSPKAFKISLETMIGYKSDRIDKLEHFNEFAKECASKLYGFDVDNIIIEKKYLMTRATNLPIKLKLKIKKGNDELDKIMYIKPFDTTRLFGLELYCSIAGIKRDYSFFFNESVIVEDSAQGKHKSEFDAESACHLNNPNYKKERIKSDIISFYLGLDDLTKEDNYVVASDGTVTIIDFDVMDREYSEEEILVIKKETAKEIEITIDKYNLLYTDQKKLLRSQVHKEKDKIYRILNLLESLKNRELSKIGIYIKRNMLHLLSNDKV